MTTTVSRRNFIATLGSLAAATPVAGRTLTDMLQDFPKGVEIKPLARPVSAIIIGHGGRGGLYSSFAPRLKDEWRIVGVAEPIDYRREAAVEAHGIPASQTFTTWEQVFQKPKFADVCVISTPDDLHYGPAMAALQAGYDLLLEKPIAMTWQQCQDILQLATKKDAIVGICHVLRYAPYFQYLRHVIASGVVGEVVSIQHMEPIQHIHMSHSFVRGIWRNHQVALPIILAKSCHDLDLLYWYLGKPCRRVSSFAGLGHFKAEKAPKGAPAYCLDGCPHSSTCPYYAPDIYVNKKLWETHHIVSRDRSDAAILEQLKRGPFGRCVYHCDNDQPDHTVVNLEFEGGTTAAFSMEAMTNYGGRRTRVFGSAGDLVGDENTLEIYDFSKRQKRIWDVKEAGASLDGHGGGDFRMVRDFCQAVSRHDVSLLSSNLKDSMESHLMGFQAEASRLQGGRVMEVRG